MCTLLGRQERVEHEDFGVQPNLLNPWVVVIVGQACNVLRSPCPARAGVHFKRVPTAPLQRCMHPLQVATSSGHPLKTAPWTAVIQSRARATLCSLLASQVNSDTGAGAGHHTHRPVHAPRLQTPRLAEQRGFACMEQDTG